MKLLGFFIFLAIAGLAFWILIFLSLFLPYMITLLVTDKVNPKLAEKLAGACDSENDGAC